MNQPHHKVNAEETPDGDYHFICPICGYEVLVGVNPPEVRILNRGDENAFHSGVVTEDDVK